MMDRPAKLRQEHRVRRFRQEPSWIVSCCTKFVIGVWMLSADVAVAQTNGTIHEINPFQLAAMEATSLPPDNEKDSVLPPSDGANGLLIPSGGSVKPPAQSLLPQPVHPEVQPKTFDWAGAA